MNLLLTGEIRVGKSTVLNKILKKFNTGSIDGLLTLPIIENNIIEGFYLKSFDGRAETFAHTEFDKTRSFGLFGVDLDVFNSLGVDVLGNAVSSDLIVIDELGMMEQDAHLFVRELVNLFEERENVFLVVQQRALDFWLSKIGRQRFDLNFTITMENRNTLPEIILKQLA